MTVFSFLHRNKPVFGEVLKETAEDGSVTFTATIPLHPEHVGVDVTMTGAVDRARLSLAGVDTTKGTPQ